MNDESPLVGSRRPSKLRVAMNYLCYCFGIGNSYTASSASLSQSGGGASHDYEIDPVAFLTKYLPSYSHLHPVSSFLTMLILYHFLSIFIENSAFL